MNRLANERVAEMSKINSQLQEKINLVENMTKSAQEKNDALEKDIAKLETQKSTYTKLNEKLKIELGVVVEKEKNLTIKQLYLEKKIQEQTKKLLRTEKMAIIGQFSSRLAHDIRNPLAIVKSTHALLCKNPRISVTERNKISNKNR